MKSASKRPRFEDLGGLDPVAQLAVAVGFAVGVAPEAGGGVADGVLAEGVEADPVVAHRASPATGPTSTGSDGSAVHSVSDPS